MFGTPVQALRITVHIRIERIQRRAARWCLRRYNNTSRVTSMLEDLEWRIFEQCRINSRLTVLFKFTWGLLSVKSHRLLRPVMRRTCRSHSESFIPRSTSLSSEYLPFFSRRIIQWNNLPASVFSEHCCLDTFKAHVSCLNHLPVY